MAEPPAAERLPIRMLHDRVLVSLEGESAERHTGGGILIPSTVSVGSDGTAATFRYYAKVFQTNYQLTQDYGSVQWKIVLGADGPKAGDFVGPTTGVINWESASAKLQAITIQLAADGAPNGRVHCMKLVAL